MKNLLFLVHRIPFPPNKGDKIRSFHLLQYLTDRYRVFLGTFVDDPKDWRHVKQVQSLCVESCFLPLKPRREKVRSIKGFLTGQALTLPYYSNSNMQKWVNTVVEENRIDCGFVFSSAMAQYVACHQFKYKIIDFVDVDSDKWLQYANTKSWPLSWVYRRESHLLFNYDREIAKIFDRSIFVSAKEAELFKHLVPEASDRVTHIDNGVDIEYFSPEKALVNPYSEEQVVMVYTGAMDYWANVDAVVWFAKEVFPAIHERIPNARFYIVGGKPTDSVRNLNNINGVDVVGAVDDVRPFVKYSQLSVAPLRIARGVQNKVLEAMAMGKPVLATNSAMEGIEASSDLDVFITDDAKTMAEKALTLLTSTPFQGISKKNRQCVIDRYSWKKNLEKLGLILQHGK